MVGGLRWSVLHVGHASKDGSNGRDLEFIRRVICAGIYR